jgi:hypothetical protein
MHMLGLRALVTSVVDPPQGPAKQTANRWHIERPACVEQVGDGDSGVCVSVNGTRSGLLVP